ncbi:hypothetical protein PGLA_26205 [Paenibacillus glacialis]|uniref:Uncharacterized protein n=1 Tax=Paenibacillus glacialis TaxID=494026 RepID=A0A168C1Y2_9BACL|nr:hypothetical protein PGLA_26205 [Paenibacillus glacialis]
MSTNCISVFKEAYPRILCLFLNIHVNISSLEFMRLGGGPGIPRTIDKEYAAVQFRVNDETYLENINISVKGKLYKRFFLDPKFVGSIMIDNFDELTICFF